MRCAILLVPLLALLAIACGDDDSSPTPSPTPSRSPAVALPTPTPTPALFACPKLEELASYWPPQGAVSYVYGDAENQVDASNYPFQQVRVLGIACGDARGQGQDAYIAYRLPPQSEIEIWGPILLAALHSGEGSLRSVGILSGWIELGELRLQDLTGDGKDEIILTGPIGARSGEASVWGWADGRYSNIFSRFFDAVGGDPQFRDLDGDGSVEIVVGERVSGPPWPIASRWDGQAFRPALFPQVYDEFIARTQDSLQQFDPAKFPSDASVRRTLLGHAYRLQGRTDEAMAEYSQAWLLASRLGPLPACTDAVQGVETYYRLINMRALTWAYAMVAYARPFPDFAFLFAGKQFRLREQPRLVGQDGDVAIVDVRLSVKELTPEGEVEEQLSGTWNVRLQDQSCLLEGGDIPLVP